jgi:DNA-binding IclR family transcriptional regulator
MRLKRLVRETQARGFAIHDGVRSGARALGFALRHDEGQCVAAISISADRKRLPESRWPELSELLHKTALRIQRGFP